MVHPGDKLERVDRAQRDKKLVLVAPASFGQVTMAFRTGTWPHTDARFVSHLSRHTCQVLVRDVDTTAQ